ncbi:MAG: metallophosphoesterase [Acidobacteriota bacterium]
MRLRSLLVLAALVAGLSLAFAQASPDDLRFVFLGDRTGEAQPGVYEKIWKALAAEKPAFVVSAGDTIQGLDDAGAESEWRHVESILSPYRAIPLFLAPGNHDIWSEQSERLFVKYAGHPVHYSFDRGPAHFTVLDNSRADVLPAAELAFLEQDLKSHASRPVKFIVSHRPGWIFNVLLRNPDFPLHQLARKYGVQYVIAGHVHQLLHYSLDGVEYLSLPSAGGHLRGSRKYEDGWFFGYTVVDVRKTGDAFRIEPGIHPLGGPVTDLRRWGPAGLIPTP